MKAKCRKCGDTVEVTRPKEFKSCKCGAISLDYGDEYYYRVCGAPEDFDGEIEDAPEVGFTDDPAERAMGIIGEENIGGESGPRKRVLRDIDDLEPGSRVMVAGHEAVAKKSLFSPEKAAGLRDPDNPSEAGVAEISLDTANARMVDTNLNNIGTYLEELSITLEEMSDLVNKISRLVRERSDKSEEFSRMIKGE